MTIVDEGHLGKRVALSAGVLCVMQETWKMQVRQ